MISQIFVKDFILLDHVDLTLHDQMSAFTGETGAGKSLLMDAIGILKGDRAKASMVKEGKEKAIIEGVFDIPETHVAYQMLSDAGYDMEEGQIIVTREFTNEGKSSTRINQRNASVSFLREVMATLVDLHSQHDSQYLLNSKYHLSLLDNFLQDTPLFDKVKLTYRAYAQCHEEYEKLLSSDYQENDLDFLTAQLNEIEDCAIEEDELDTLQEEVKQMLDYEKINASLSFALASLSNDAGALTKLYDASHALNNAHTSDETLVAYTTELNDFYYEMEDFVERFKDYYHGLEFDEASLNEKQERIAFIHKMYRKYGGSYQAMQDKKQSLLEIIDMILHRQDRLKKLSDELKIKQTEYQNAAYELHELRQAKALQLEQLVIQQLQDLCLPHAQFKIHFETFDGNSSGIDKVEFLISMNAGEKLNPLSATASGGELSRFMLGLKTVFTKLQGIETVIFDEIDTGVSGAVAFAIGKKMQELAKHTQVFCVTHLAGVAACADHQYEVKKTSEDNATSTMIHPLDENERIHQLAMISSGSLSEKSIALASELLEKGKR